MVQPLRPPLLASSSPTARLTLSSKHELPSVGMGLVCREKQKCGQLDASVETFLRSGGRLLDTAPTYGKGLSHQKLGLGLRASRVPRSQVWIQTKVPIASMGFEPTLALIDHSIRSIFNSTSVHTHYLDCVLIHRPNTDTRSKRNARAGTGAVSYTHLTLPTKA